MRSKIKQSGLGSVSTMRFVLFSGGSELSDDSWVSSFIGDFKVFLVLSGIDNGVPSRLVLCPEKIEV